MSPSIKKLPPRLDIIADFVPKGSVVADIGCDHGLLSLALAEKCDHIYAVDSSQKSLEKAKKLMKQQNMATKVTMLHGWGLEPLLNQRPCDTIVLSGMGLLTISQILTGTKRKLSRRSNDYMVIDTESHVDISLLESFGIQRIILQPWPPHIISYLELIHSFQKNNWNIENQDILQVDKEHYLTTSMSNKVEISDNIPSTRSRVFDSMPLSTLQSNSRCFDAWSSYAKKYADDIQLKLKWLEKHPLSTTCKNLEYSELKSLHASILKQCQL